MMDVALLLFGAHLGGSGAFTVHLAELLTRELGLDVGVYKYGKRTTKRNYIIRSDMPITYSIMAAEDLAALTTEVPAIITYLADYRKGDNLTIACELVGMGVLLATHDYRAVYPDILAQSNANMVVCSDTLFDHLCECCDHKVTQLPQPYVRSYTQTRCKYNAVFMSRIDFEKHMELLLDCNAMLPAELCIQLYGAVDSRYAHWRLDANYPDWRQYYRGRPEKLGLSAIDICALGTYAVDMSTLGGVDGGRTQYSFLEAMDAGVCLIINREWLRHPGCMKEGVNCLAVDSAEELAGLLSIEPPELNYSGVLFDATSLETAQAWYETILEAHDGA